MNTPIKITEDKNLKVLNLNKINYLYYILIEFFSIADLLIIWFT